MIFLQKLQERKCSFEKSKYTDDNSKEEWKNVLTLSCMSSDESGFDDDNNEILINHKLPWLSDRVQNFMMLLDQETTKSKSPQAKRQMKKRIDGLPSSRPMPADEGIQPSWVFQ